MRTIVVAFPRSKNKKERVASSLHDKHLRPSNKFYLQWLDDEPFPRRKSLTEKKFLLEMSLGSNRQNHSQCKIDSATEVVIHEF